MTAFGTDETYRQILVKRGLPGPGEPLKPYELSYEKYVERAKRHAANKKPEKASQAEEKGHIIQTEDSEQMRAIAEGSMARYNLKAIEEFKARMRKTKAGAKRKAYRRLADHIALDDKKFWVCDDFVDEQFKTDRWDTEPEKTWQKKAAEAACATKAPRSYFDLIKADERKRIKYAEGSASSSAEAAHRQKKLDKIDDKFKAITAKDIKAAKRLAAPYKQSIIDLDDKVLQLQKEGRYYKQKHDAWKDLADSTDARHSEQDEIYNMNFADYYGGVPIGDHGNNFEGMNVYDQIHGEMDENFHNAQYVDSDNEIID